MLLQAILGLEIDGGGRQLTFNRPYIPDWLGHVTLRRVPVGAHKVDVHIARDRYGNAELDVLSCSNQVEVKLI